MSEVGSFFNAKQVLFRVIPRPLTFGESMWDDSPPFRPGRRPLPPRPYPGRRGPCSTGKGTVLGSGKWKPLESSTDDRSTVPTVDVGRVTVRVPVKVRRGPDLGSVVTQC